MNIIITGSTGMVGKSILLEAMEDERIEKILLINRKSVDIDNNKITEILLSDFTKIDSFKDKFVGYDALFHCMGVSAVGMSEEKYRHLTYDISKAIVDVAYSINPKMMVSYVSGVGTDSSEKSKTMWARVKGKTENYILNRGFYKAYMIRLGAILPEKGIRSRTQLYNFFYVLFRPFFLLMKKSNNIVTTTNFGKAMINLLYQTVYEKYIDNKQMNLLAI